MDIIKQLATELHIKNSQAEAAVRLIDEGNTIPFIARYRKEVTGALNDEVLRDLNERLQYLRNLEEKKAQVIHAIDEQGKLTKELEQKIMAAVTLVAVDDLYRPYRPKKRTRALMAKEKGLEPLANILLLQKTRQSMEKEAEAYIDVEQGVETVADALAGAKDIIAEMVADRSDYRKSIREWTMKEGFLTVKARDEKAESVYEMYYDFREPLSKMTGYRVLAINRGEKEKYLNVKVEAPEPQIIHALNKTMIHGDNSFTEGLLKEAIEDGYRRLIAPAIERDIRNELTEQAQAGAITVFGKNLKQLLMQPPIKGQTVLGWDPAFRTGCKLAVVDPTGKVLDTVVVYPTAPQFKVEEAKKKVHSLIRKYHITLISLGNGTASRESEQVITELLKEIPEKVSYVIVNEAGASVYSASKLATEEFPEFDVGQRSAASIARRLQDPLAELVKIEPKAIGVGQYQHDMNQKKLEETLHGVVEDCVNKVGVDLNTASVSLLSYISGISKTVAKNIVAYREANGTFHSREELKKVSKLGPKAFLQCAGFLRISGGDNPLDNTGVHPESYDAAGKLLRQMGYEQEQIAAGGLTDLRKKIKNIDHLAEELNVGALTLRDIVDELEKPGRDPRNDMPKPILRTDVLEMKDLKEGMILKGTVRNVIDFGAFVDIGVHQDGLVHISQMTDRFIKHPMEVVSVGDVVDVKVLGVDLSKKRIQLSMKL
ncbi:MAG: Tex family protein [Anaerobutyricum sp.]|nr:RNA-binding transcriptional accessory protein [Eubacterium sp.]MDY6046859.1 Tex family protein [Anaerobutyricum sp.]